MSSAVWQHLPSTAGGFYRGSVPVSVSGEVRGGLDNADVGCEGRPLPGLVGQSLFFRERDSVDGNVSQSSRPCEHGKGVTSFHSVAQQLSYSPSTGHQRVHSQLPVCVHAASSLSPGPAVPSKRGFAYSQWF